MITYLKSEHTGFKDGVAQNRVELSASSVDELASVKNISDGSIAWIIPSGEFYGYADGEWHLQ